MRVLPALSVAAKLLLLGLLAYAMTHLDMPRFAGKAMEVRALTYPLATVLIPIGWHFMGRPRPYPHAADLLFVSPFLVDIGGNVADLYDRFVWFDDAAHATTWLLLVLAFGALLLRLRLPAWITAGLCVGFGSVTHVLWEIAEYLLMQSGTTGLQLTYGDTIGDLALSLSGTLAAGLITGVRASRGRLGIPARTESGVNR